jgi:lauroyl/myristoyl acyltransferase
MTTSVPSVIRATAERLVDSLRRLLPAALVPALVDVRFRIAWSRASVREDARRHMQFLLERTRPEADREAAARGYVRHMIWRGEMRWHPKVITRQRIVGIEHLIAARERGHGVILNFMHHGAYDGAFPSLARLGVPCHMLVHSYMTRADAPRWLQQHLRVSSSDGGTPVSSEVGTAGITDLLTGGAVVAIASDVPGRTPLRFAGREVLGSFGAARIAVSTGAPVVVMTAEIDEQGPFQRLHEALWPEDFAAPAALLEQMLLMQERALVAWPQAADLPLSRWGNPQSDTGTAP